MGAFDREPNLTKSEFADREFVWHGGEYLGMHESGEFQGPARPKARVIVSDLANPGDRKTFTVYGVMAEQVQRMDASDVPAVVRIAQDGRANVLDKVRDFEPGQAPA